MKRYHFPLSAVLRVRHVELARKRQSFAETTMDLTRAYAAEEAAQTHYDAVPDMLAPTDTSSFSDWRALGERAAIALALAGGKVTTATSQHEVARRALAEAERRLRVLERLDERRRAEWRLANERADAAALDDYANARSAFDMQERRNGG